MMITGSFKFVISSDGKISGEYVKDPSNKLPLYRIDINKSDWKGIYYMAASSNKIKMGVVEIKSSDGDV